MCLFVVSQSVIFTHQDTFTEWSDSHFDSKIQFSHWNIVTLFTFTVFCILALSMYKVAHIEFHHQCMQPPTLAYSKAWNNGFNIKVSINLPQKRFIFLKDFYKWRNWMPNFIFKSHFVWNVSSNGHWNDKFHKAKKPIVIIHLLRSVKFALKLLKLTAPQDKTRSQGNEQASKSPPCYIYTL